MGHQARMSLRDRAIMNTSDHEYIMFEGREVKVRTVSDLHPRFYVVSAMERKVRAVSGAF